MSSCGADGNSARTTTDAEGYYLFTGLTPGVYSLEFVLPAGYAGFTRQGSGADDGVDSDVNPTTGRTEQIELSPGDNDLSWYAGVVVQPPTAITLTNLTVIMENGQLIVRWTTSSELSTAGFFIRVGAGDSFDNSIQRVSQMIASQGSQGGSYEMVIPYDAQVDPARPDLRVWLVEIEVDGNEVIYGPAPISTRVYLPLISSEGAPRGPRGAVPTDGAQRRFVPLFESEEEVTVGSPVQPQDIPTLDQRVIDWTCYLLGDLPMSSDSSNSFLSSMGRMCGR
ncbi:MAG: SdrD B-like domain-containing protein [Caldilineaceae bacterium]